MSQFEGVWIPAALMKRSDLSLQMRVVLAYCASFKERCFASNKHIAEQTGIPEKTVRNCLTKARKMGLLNGRDFPKDFNNLSPIGTSLSPIGAHRTKGEQSIEQREECPHKGQIVKRDLESVEVIEMSEEDIAWIRKQCGESDWKHLSANVRVLSPNCSAAAVG